MYIADGDDVGIVLLVEIIEVGLVLEVVRVNFAGLNNVVGLDIVGELLDVKGHALSCEYLFGNGEDFGVRCGGGGDGYRLTLESVIVDGGIVAVTGALDNADNRAVILGGDEIGDLLALESGGESLDLVGILCAFLGGEDVRLCARGAVNGEIVLYGVKTRGDSVVRVDNGVVNILENVGKLSGLNLFEGDVLRILFDVSYGCGDARAVLELDYALLLEEKKRTCLIGSVVGNGDGDALAARRAGGEAEDAAQREDCGKNDRYCLFHVGCLLCILIYKVSVKTVSLIHAPCGTFANALYQRAKTI